MNQNPSLIQRFFSDTPNEFKIVQLVGLLLILAHAVLVHYNITGALVDDMQTVGFTTAFLSQFVVKELPKIEAAPNIATGLITAVPDMIAAFDSLKTALADHSGTITSALGDVLGAVKDLSAAPAAQPSDSPAPAIAVAAAPAPAVIDTGAIEVKS